MKDQDLYFIWNTVAVGRKGVAGKIDDIRGGQWGHI